jgi:hypothetical protein
VIPSNNHLWSSSLFQHIQHFCLEDVIDRFDSDSSTRLRHCKDIHTRDLLVSILLQSRSGVRLGKDEMTNGVIIDEFSQHQTHDFHRYSRSTVLEHLQISLDLRGIESCVPSKELKTRYERFHHYSSAWPSVWERRAYLSDRIVSP